ncbi:Venom dipeptidyl peptidase 4 [Orchesella cincta]|uniref:Venom dipeptidyl peptidase 4 n=1 Tax=Orchesella cincta TaxID=48709 RepID=A0A1D2N8M9_ORCCI|nr:Venom dipeptidyl peptidase 4 [Orchesella cincta]
MTSRYNSQSSLLVVCLLLGTVGTVFGSQGSFSGGALPPKSAQSINQEELEPITLEDILRGTLGARGFSGQWVPEADQDDWIQMTEGDNIVRYNIVTGDKTTFTNLTEIREKFTQNGGEAYAGVSFSNDGKFALVEHGRSSLWRYSSVAKYDIYDLETKTFTRLQPEGSPVDNQPVLQLVKWSPTGSGIAFVFGYNIYYRADSVPTTTVRQVTTDGSDEGAIYNGITDWVYEEEMFFTPTALWISPSAQNLAFVQFDNSKVEDFQWPIYGEPNSGKSYPEYRTIRYPKAGTENPEAVVKVVSLTDTSDEPRNLEYNETLYVGHLIGTVLWATDTKLMVTTLNRVQTLSQFHLCTADTNFCEQIHNYDPPSGWVDMNVPKVSGDGTSFIFVRATGPQSDDSRSYKHIVLLNSDGTWKEVTSGRLSVDSILGWDTENHVVYFSGSFWNNTHANPTETQIYSVLDNGTDPNSAFRCITCPLRNSKDVQCRDNSVSFSSKFTKFIHRCNGPDVPEITTRNTLTGEEIANPGPTLVDNAALREALSKKAVPFTEEYLVPVGEEDNKFEARARLYFPTDYDATKSYPLLISVYGGPGSQNLGQGYGMSWETSLVSSKNIIFGYIDGRGTAKQSTDHLFTMHRKLGTVEIEDQITVGKWLIENVPGIDPTKTSIWGWSYGGYATSKVMQKDTENVYKCGISVAPVTSWRYYDTIYTERYMGLPTENDNAQSYIDSAVTLDVENFKQKQFMLVHGNADDNVHYQQSMVLARALENADVFFHQLSYPDENHGIGSVRPHLYHSLEHFLFNECYGSPNQETDPTTTANTGTDATTTQGTGNPSSSTEAGAASFSQPLAVLLINCIYLISRYAF